MTALEWIDTHGGPAAIARATGYKPGAVALWRHRNKIPRTAWPEVIEAFEDTTLQALKEIEVSAPAEGAAEDRPAA